MLADGTMGSRMAGAKPEMLQHLVDQNWKGRKDGKGFFIYKGKKKEPHQEVLDYVEKSIKQRDAELTKEQIQDRYLSLRERSSNLPPGGHPQVAGRRRLGGRLRDG